MKNFICSNCGYSDVQKSFCKDVNTAVGKTIVWTIKTFFSGLSGIIWLISLIICLCLPPIGWIFVIPLLFYPILSSNKNKSNNNTNICPECGAANCLVPLNSPRGKKLYKEYYAEKDIAYSQKDTEYIEFRDKYNIKDE